MASVESQSPEMYYELTSTMLPSGYKFGSLSNSTIIRLTNVENFRGGTLSFARWLGSFYPRVQLSCTIETKITNLQQPALNFDRPGRYSLPRLKVDRVSTFSARFPRLPHLVRDHMAQEYPQRPRRLCSLY